MTEHHDSSPADPVNVSTDPDEVRKVHELIESMDIAMLTTVDSSSSHGRLTSRPLSTQVAEEDGDVLFLVRDSSAVVRDVEAWCEKVAAELQSFTALGAPWTR